MEDGLAKNKVCATLRSGSGATPRVTLRSRAKGEGNLEVMGEDKRIGKGGGQPQGQGQPGGHGQGCSMTGLGMIPGTTSSRETGLRTKTNTRMMV